MNPDLFWTSEDGQILVVRPKDERTVSLELAFWPRSAAELELITNRREQLQFSLRSTLARIGMEFMPQGTPQIAGGRVELHAEAFLYDPSFPNAAYWRKLLRPGVPVGRLFYAPAAAKLTTAEIWDAVRENRIKLPNTISIDRQGRVFLTPHQVNYTLTPRLTRDAFERLVSGQAGRRFLDKVQIRHDAAPLTVPPHSGILTSCSLYLKEHFVVLNQGEGNFGIHTSAVLLDPIKTFGTNVMLEIYNTGEQPVVNPLVSVEVFRAPETVDPEAKSLQKKRARLLRTADTVFSGLDTHPPRPPAAQPAPRSRLSVRGQSAMMENRSLLVSASELRGETKDILEKLGDTFGHRTVVEALDAVPAGADTLIVDYFPNLLEHIELLSRLPSLSLRRIIFRRPSRTHGFFLSGNAHARLDTYHATGLDVYWFNGQMGDLFLHTYKKEHGFFLREELVRRFQETTILAFYGSAVGLSDEQTRRISQLIDKVTGFIGPNVAVLTGGGGGVMRLATDQARQKEALTGACFLELEAQPPELGVDFFNTFQETARHNRQKWFEVADFCIFNVGGMGTLEEIGIELCNLKLGIRPRVPYVFYDARYFRDLRRQIREMVATHRAPAWMLDYILFTDDADEVVAFYRKKLQVL